MEFFYSPKIDKQLKEIKKKDPALYKKIFTKLDFFRNFQNHPSLRIHKLQGNLHNYWSLSVEENIRIIFYYSDVGVVFFMIGTHDQMYKN